MLLAQVASPPPAETNAWLMILGMLAGLYWLGRQIYLSHCPKQTETERYVTHGQFDLFKSEVKNELAGFKNEVKNELTEFKKDINSHMDKQDKYTQEAFHRSGTVQQTMVNDLAFLRGVMQAAAGAPKLVTAGSQQ